jgi:hypothetical protein
MFNKEWAFAVSETLRNDPQGRVASEVIFEAKGYKPRMPDDVYLPIDWAEPKEEDLTDDYPKDES